MSYAEAAPRRTRFQLGDALQAAFDAVFANLAVFLLLALTLSAAPNFLAAAVLAPLVRNGASGLTFSVAVLTWFVGLAGSVLLQGALVRAVVSHLNGEKPRFGDCLRASVAVALPLLAIAFLFAIASTLGFALLIAPGLYVLAAWGLAAPVQVVERAGVLGSFSRSAELTAGARWPVLGALIVFGIIGFIVLLIGAAVAGLIVGLNIFALGARIAAPTDWLAFATAAAIRAALSSVAVIFFHVGAAAVYYELRRVKEGAAPAAIAATFS